jgi:hypothetical protein
MSQERAGDLHAAEQSWRASCGYQAASRRTLRKFALHGHFEGSDFQCQVAPAQRRYGYVLFRWGLIQFVQDDSLRRCKVLSALLVSSPRDENPRGWLGKSSRTHLKWKRLPCLNRAPPIFSLDNYFAFDSTLLKLPININLMRGYFAALQGLVLFNGYGFDFILIVNGLKDSLHQLFIAHAPCFSSF